MTQEEKQKITKISKQFAGGFKDMFGSINNTGWLIVDPLSAYLNAVGYENELKELPKCEDHHQVLIMIFKDGSTFIPAGKDLNKPKCKNWMWL